MNLKVKKIDIKPEFKEQINNTIGRKNLEITYYNGYIVEFNKCNLQSISPHKIVISNDEKNLLIMTYADFAAKDGLYYVDGNKCPLTITSLREYVRNYF